MLFNQVKIPQKHLEESYKIALEDSLFACFYKLCQLRPEEKLVFWKDEKGHFSHSLTNYEIFKIRLPNLKEIQFGSFESGHYFLQ